MKRSLSWIVALPMGCLILTATAHADASCAAWQKAIKAGMAQTRIHAAIDSPLDPEAVKMGWKPTLMHCIVIDNVQYSNVLHKDFGRTAVAQPELRQMATDLLGFQAEAGCQAAGREQRGGVDTLIYSAGTDLGNGPARLRLWVDSSTGLPVRAVSDEPATDTTFSVDKTSGKNAAVVKTTANGKRIVSTHAYIYGALVKPPSQGKVDAQAQAALAALLKP